MRADNSIHLVTAAKQRHERTRTRAIAAMHDLDQAGEMLTFESVASHAGVSRSWIYTQTDIKDEIHRLRSHNQHQPSPSPPAAQRASDESLRQRLETTNRRNRELTDENQRLRRQLAHTLGQLRDHDAATQNADVTNQPEPRQPVADSGTANPARTR